MVTIGLSAETDCISANKSLAKQEFVWVIILSKGQKGELYFLSQTEVML